MIYSMSDIHGCIAELQKQMEQVDLSGSNRIVFCGDYIDYGDSSCQVLDYLWDLEKTYGPEKVVILKGNHEQMFLDWIDDYRNPYPDETEKDMIFDDWLRTDFECGASTIRTFISEKQMDFLDKISRSCSLETISREAVQMILFKHEKLVQWIEEMPLYFETQSQIFVHAGINEDAGEQWRQETSEGIFLGKYPATKGKFYKTIIAGHVGTGTRSLADDQSYHDVFYDGESHYYIDGSVYKGGKMLLLAYDEESGKYYQAENGKMIPVRQF